MLGRGYRADESCSLSLTTIGYRADESCSLSLTTIGYRADESCSLSLTTIGYRADESCSLSLTTIGYRADESCSLSLTTVGYRADESCSLSLTTVGYRADESAKQTPIEQNAPFIFGVVYNKPYRRKSKLVYIRNSVTGSTNMATPLYFEPCAKSPFGQWRLEMEIESIGNWLTAHAYN